MDDIFTFQNFKPSIFNQEEVSILYQNTREEEFNKFTNVVVEVKYSKRNFDGLVEQLKKYHDVLNKIIDKQILYIGITSSKNIYKKELNKQRHNLNKFNCLIISLKNSTLFGRQMTKFIDWKKIYEDEQKFDELNNKIENINNKIDKKIDNLNKKIDLLFTYFNIQKP